MPTTPWLSIVAFKKDAQASFMWTQWEKTDHSQQCWNLGSSMANAGLSMSCSSESRACEYSCSPLFIHIFILASQMYFELLLGPGSMPGSVLDAGERMMNEISVVPTLMKLTSRGRQETLHMG